MFEERMLAKDIGLLVRSGFWYRNLVTIHFVR